MRNRVRDSKGQRLLPIADRLHVHADGLPHRAVAAIGGDH